MNCSTTQQILERHPEMATLCQRAMTLFLAAELDEADRTLRQGERELKGAGRRIRSCLALVRAQIRDNQGRSEENIRDIRELLQKLGEDHENLRTALRLQIGHSHCVLGRLTKAQEVLDEAYAQAEKSDDPLLLAQAALRQAMLNFRLRDWDASSRYAKQCVDIAQDHKDPVLALYGKILLGKNTTQSGDPAAALEQFQLLQDEAKKLGHKLIEAKLLSEIATCYCDLEKLEESLNCLTEAEKALASSGPAMHVLAAGRGNVFLRKGKHDEATRHFEEAAKIANSVGDRYATARWIQNQAISFRDRGDSERAGRLIDEASKMLLDSGDKRGADRCTQALQPPPKRKSVE